MLALDILMLRHIRYAAAPIYDIADADAAISPFHACRLLITRHADYYFLFDFLHSLFIIAFHADIIFAIAFHSC